MNKKKAYSIGIGGLKNGKHQFELELTSKLLEIFESELMENISGKAILHLAKSETSIDVDILLDAKIKLLSDRSLREYEDTLAAEQKVFFKFSDHFEMLEDDLFKIPFNESNLDFAQILYDLIAVSLPTKRLHPDEDELEDVFYSTLEDDEIEEEVDDQDENEEEKPSDPRWDILKKLK
ncbi:YceD family protein [Flammeovirga kamogawensis]|uniref:DUF177 domain-containing protein n=1 Tax=Flammeovirga kamogawensis TaxID=373891 RepID=A0ABX8GWV8_9BACT|nr:DUF177 domain-containing protein [Flammeovirga kamogawensis]MBB6460666.1 uncharacterized metal-binding protein YceD (DUF177 family) [Flammeovirga kamogawensis]QWG08021.1 DUF177 domain-containing protein [Flammeovirga kamogawensis]TRX69828.1 DUF177 domain-containing protein [Flammeovirga kamogawensis]